MEKRQRMDRREFLKYASLGSLGAAALLFGSGRTAKAQLSAVLEFLGKIPEEVLKALPEALHEINANQERYMKLFMQDPRGLLENEFGISLPFTKYQVIAFDLSTEDTEWFKVMADPPYPYEPEIKIGPVAIGFAEGRVGLILRERGP